MVQAELELHTSAAILEAHRSSWRIHWNSSESWNGSAWSETGDLNTARRGLSGTGGDNTSSLVFLGTPPLKTNTELWNGTSWTELNDLSTAREGAAPGSSFGTSNTFAAGGYNGGTNAVEDWTASLANKTITAS